MTVFQEFAIQFQEKYTSLGFIKIKKTFARIVNDVLQTFTYIERRNICDIQFTVEPLCKNIDFIDVGTYMLSEFSPEVSALYDGWLYDKYSVNSQKDCSQKIFDVVDRYLIPFFRESDCCASALPQLIKLDELFDNNRLKALALRGSTDGAPPWQERSLASIEKYIMALKSHDFEYALKYIEWWQQKHFWPLMKQRYNPLATKQPDIVYSRNEKYFQKLTEHKRKIESNDISSLDMELQIAEQHSIERISEISPKLAKQARG